MWAPPEQIDQGKFALSVAVKVLEFYEEKFQVDYPLPKQGIKKVDQLMNRFFFLLIRKLTNILHWHYIFF